MKSYEWFDWAVENVRIGHTIFRLSLKRHVGEMSVKAVALRAVKHENGSTLGVVTYNNQPNRHVSVGWCHPLECVVAGEDRAWDTFMSLNMSPEEEWLTESWCVCTFEDLIAHELQYISPRNFLATEYIARICGMMHQEATTTSNVNKRIVLRHAEGHLEGLLREERRVLASLSAGL